ncbi:MAG TPA: proton-conducting transporter membrane subunit [Negativicutes bacterium]|nr:proton-conducting transporter membrane subunit [Negativicutes bacterium]
MAIVTSWRPTIANWISHGLAAAGCIVMIILAWKIFGQSQPEHFFVGRWLHSGVVTFRIDALAAFFLLLLGIVGAASAIYAIGYTTEHYSPRYFILPTLFNLFLLSLFLVVTASHIGVFLIVWELMTLTSLFLILYEYEHSANIRAGFVYVVMTHIGTAFIIGAFFILAKSAGSLSFQMLGGTALTEQSRNLVFVFAFIGFGTKAGIIPLHIWLPKAHPAAPSHVSALLSGVMLKMAIYGMCRFYLEFLGVGPTWWGVLVMSFGILSAFMGVLYALMENDIKRLLAYSSLENMGVILLGIGAGMVYASNHQTLLAGLAWSAALYHVFNHAIFKSLLFMGAGSVVRAVGSREMDTMGGLIHRMPYTAMVFLVGSAAISALPPLNGFVSEWMTLQALFFLPTAIPGLAGKMFGAFLFITLGMTAAIVAACFVKTFGITFLARPRTKKAENAKEASWVSIFPMAALALACIGLGAWPPFLLQLTNRIIGSYAGVSTEGLFQQEWRGTVFQADPAFGILSVNSVVVLVSIGCLIAVILYFLQGKPLKEIQEVWACGIVPTYRNQYTSMGFSKPVRWAFRWVLRTQRERIVDENENRYVGRKLAYHQTIHYIFDEAFYNPIQHWILRRANYVKRLQAGSVQLYVGYILIVTIVVLVWSSRN